MADTYTAQVGEYTPSHKFWPSLRLEDGRSTSSLGSVFGLRWQHRTSHGTPRRLLQTRSDVLLTQLDWRRALQPRLDETGEVANCVQQGNWLCGAATSRYAPKKGRFYFVFLAILM